MVKSEILLKIATLNLCLCLKYEKDLVKTILQKNDIDILLMQEIELKVAYNFELLCIPGYTLECEENDYKRRVGFYIRDSLKYMRCQNLEVQNSHIIIIDLENVHQIKKRIIKIHHSFDPNGETAKELFNRQLKSVLLINSNAF